MSVDCQNAGQNIAPKIAAVWLPDASRALSTFISLPSTAAYEELMAAGGTYLSYEDRVLLPTAWRTGIDPTVIVAVRGGHEEIARRFNAVLWSLTGSTKQRQAAMSLRHALLQQIETCETAVRAALPDPDGFRRRRESRTDGRATG